MRPQGITAFVRFRTSAKTTEEEGYVMLEKLRERLYRAQKERQDQSCGQLQERPVDLVKVCFVLLALQFHVNVLGLFSGGNCKQVSRIVAGLETDILMEDACDAEVEEQLDCVLEDDCVPTYIWGFWETRDACMHRTSGSWTLGSQSHDPLGVRRDLASPLTQMYSHASDASAKKCCSQAFGSMCLPGLGMGTEIEAQQIRHQSCGGSRKLYADLAGGTSHVSGLSSSNFAEGSQKYGVGYDRTLDHSGQPFLPDIRTPNSNRKKPVVFRAWH